MKKLICFIMAVLLVSLCGCSSGVEVLTNDKYTILEKDGVYTMKLHEPATYTGGGGSAQNSDAPYTIEFSSVEEMKATIENGLFSTEQIMQIQRSYAKDGKNNVMICNTNKLYDVTLPEGVTASAIQWFGDSYNFSLGRGAINFTNQAVYDEYAKGFTFESGKVKIISENMIADRNAKEIIFDNLMGEPRRVVIYSHTSGSKTMTIAEQYNLDESETVPYVINFWGKCDDAYFTGYMFEFTERPSYEWVTSFGLKPYVETETE